MDGRRSTWTFNTAGLSIAGRYPTTRFSASHGEISSDKYAAKFGFRGFPVLMLVDLILVATRLDGEAGSWSCTRTIQQSSGRLTIPNRKENGVRWFRGEERGGRTRTTRCCSLFAVVWSRCRRTRSVRSSTDQHPFVAAIVAAGPLGRFGVRIAGVHAAGQVEKGEGVAMIARADAGSFGTARRRSRAGDGSRGSSRPTGFRSKASGGEAGRLKAAGSRGHVTHRLAFPGRHAAGPEAFSSVRGMAGTIAGGRRQRSSGANQGAAGEPWCGDSRRGLHRKAGSRAVTRSWAAVRLLGAVVGVRVIRGSVPGLRGSRSVHVRPCRDPGRRYVRWTEEVGRGSGVACDYNVRRSTGIPATLTSRMVSVVRASSGSVVRCPSCATCGPD